MNAVDVLNLALKADPGAVYALIENRVPCNKFLADDQFVQVGETPVAGGGFEVGALGLINAVLAAHGLPLVAAVYGGIHEGRRRILGFTEYEPDKPLRASTLD